jgi:peptidoglycan/xylan/chitin deacetylase (PgdA/CDA1 family)
MLRADSIATFYVFHPLKKRRLRVGRVPILMYHSICDVGDQTKHPYYQTHTSPSAFAAQMHHLHGSGYTSLSVGQALEYMRNPEAGPAKPVVITFDDGFLDFYTHAAPTMARYGLHATMYLPTSFIGQNSARSFVGIPCMTWDQVRELQRAGMVFGSHTVNHPQLRSVSLRQVRTELVDSKKAIEDELDGPAESFAYPYAFPEADREFISELALILREAGYRNGVSTILGTAGANDPSLFLPRLPVNSHDGSALLQAKLDGGYDWLHTVQRASKAFKVALKLNRE